GTPERSSPTAGVRVAHAGGAQWLFPAGGGGGGTPPPAVIEGRRAEPIAGRTPQAATRIHGRPRRGPDAPAMVAAVLGRGHHVGEQCSGRAPGRRAHHTAVVGPAVAGAPPEGDVDIPARARERAP